VQQQLSIGWQKEALGHRDSSRRIDCANLAGLQG